MALKTINWEDLRAHCRICFQQVKHHEQSEIVPVDQVPPDCEYESVANLLGATLLKSYEEAPVIIGGHLCKQCFATLQNVHQFREQCTVVHEFLSALHRRKAFRDEDTLTELLGRQTTGHGVRWHLARLGVISADDDALCTDTLLAKVGIVKKECETEDGQVVEPEVQAVNFPDVKPDLLQSEECKPEIHQDEYLVEFESDYDEEMDTAVEERVEEVKVKKRPGRKPGSKIKPRIVEQPIACLIPDCLELLEGQTYNDHLKEFHRYGCKQCGLVMTSKYTIGRHMTVHNNLPPTVKCTFCDRMFSSRFRMREHARSVHQQQATNYECDECGEKFESRKLLTTHRTSHLPTDCQDCTSKFDHSSKLLAHVKRSHPEKLSRCHLCPKTFPTQSYLKDHLLDHSENVVHNIEDTFDVLTLKSMSIATCPKCDKQYVSEKHRLAHMPSHDPASRPKIVVTKRSKEELAKLEYKYQCDQCDARYRLPLSLDSHMKTHSAAPFVCDSCGLFFKTKNNLKQHLTYRHSKDFRYFCEFCPKAFATSSDLSRHRRVHTNERPYSCNQCEARFKTNDGYRKHLRSHTGEKIFQCDLCDRSFMSPCSLKTHKIGHTNEKAFKCFYCELHFNVPKNRRRHILRHHPGQPTNQQPSPSSNREGELV